MSIYNILRIGPVKVDLCIKRKIDVLCMTETWRVNEHCEYNELVKLVEWYSTSLTKYKNISVGF